LAQRSVSIEDIARAAGVSHSTVSRALRNSPLISPDVRTRIQHLAGEMGYTPNALAQSLQTHRSHTLGLVVTSIADPFIADVVRGVEEIARPAGFSVFLSAAYNDPAQEVEVIETFHRRRVDGILVASGRISSNYEAHLSRVKVPTVLLNNEARGDGRRLHWVRVDDDLGAQLATDHLLHLGHRAIGYLGVANRPRSNDQRLAGYRAALAAARVAAPDAWVAMPDAAGDDTQDGPAADLAAGQRLLSQLLAAGVTAVFCFNDMVAVGALLACRSRGMVVPRDLSIVGYDDIEVARYVTPPLTTVAQPRLRLGTLATQVLLDLLAERPVQNHVLPPALAIRESTAPPCSAAIPARPIGD
jgi:LacI family transcriptional regulator/LacI family repressor for deo operon, udp, cdd, tsx, nupC, and nupG